MAQHHKWSVSEMEDMVPYERAIYSDMLIKYLAELRDKRAQWAG